MTSVKEHIRRLRIIHVATAIVLSFITLGIYLKVDKTGSLLEVKPNDLNFELMAIVAVFAITALGLVINKMQLNKTLDISPLEAKLDRYKIATIVLYATIEVMIFIMLILFLLSGLSNILLYSLLSLVYFIYHRPHPLKLIKDMKLNDEDADTIRESFK